MLWPFTTSAHGAVKYVRPGCVHTPSVWAWSSNLGNDGLWRHRCSLRARRISQRLFLLPCAWKSIITVAYLVFPFSLLWPTLLTCSSRASVTATAGSFWLQFLSSDGEGVIHSPACFSMKATSWAGDIRAKLICVVRACTRVICSSAGFGQRLLAWLISEPTCTNSFCPNWSRLP